MMPSLDPRAIKKLMKQMGMDMQEVPASEVIIKKPEGGQIVIKNPQVQKMKIPGQGESFQVTGNATESGSTKGSINRSSTSPDKQLPFVSGGSQISQADIDLVAEQAKVSKEEARKVLEANNGDIAKSILELQNK